LQNARIEHDAGVSFFAAPMRGGETGIRAMPPASVNPAHRFGALARSPRRAPRVPCRHVVASPRIAVIAMKEEDLKPERMAVALAAGLLCISPGSSDAWEHEPPTPRFQLSCTIERQKCIEKWQKLRLRLHPDGRIHDWRHIENALLEVYETDPACALMLQGTGSLDF